MNDKTALWDKLGRTDPAHTKPFTRAGGFKGTAIKPMFSYRRMTEEFGPCGTGWGIGKPEFQVVNAGEEVLVYCTVSIWYTDSKVTSSEVDSVFGVGGDKVLSKTQSGIRTDDEAFKKAFTDAVTNALKLIGVGADVHMGMFDDSKYVNDMRAEFEQEAKPEAPKTNLPLGTSAAQKKRDLEALESELLDCGSTVSWKGLVETWRVKMDKERWPDDFRKSAREKFAKRKIELSYVDDGSDTVSDIQDQFPGARIVAEQSTLMAGE